MTGTIRAVTLAVNVTDLGNGQEAIEVDIDAHGSVPPDWVVSMLRKVADDLEKDPL